MNAWLDGYLPYALARGDIPGAVVVVVKDGQVLTERGYGFADVRSEAGRPALDAVPPGIGLEAVHLDRCHAAGRAGQADLDADVNQYLDFKIPPYQGRPITLRDIMTHTAGFEEQVKDLITTGQQGDSAA